MASPTTLLTKGTTKMATDTIKAEARHFVRTGDVRQTVMAYSRSNAELFWSIVRKLENRSQEVVGKPRG